MADNSRLNIIGRASPEYIDPVCGMTVDPADAAGSHQYRGKTYYFCNLACLQHFKTDPTKFIQGEKSVAPPKSHLDPVCGMEVDPANAAGVVEHNGQNYYFCNPSCAQKFKANPNKYLTSGKTDMVDSAGVEYTCPMDPEVRADRTRLLSEMWNGARAGARCASAGEDGMDLSNASRGRAT